MLDLHEGVREIFLDAQAPVFEAIWAAYAADHGRRSHHGPNHALQRNAARTVRRAAARLARQTT